MEISFSGMSINGSKWLPVIPAAIMLVPLVLVMTGVISSRQTNDAMGYAHEAVLGGLGAGLFLFGFMRLRVKRLIEDTPSSKVRSVAMGLTEVSGIARAKYPMKSPISGADCVYFRFLVEKETRGSRGRSHWSTVRQGVSTAYFYVEDETGKLLVDPMGAEGMLVRDYYTTDSSGSLFGSKMRYSEWYILPGDYVYVLGSVRKFKDAGLDRKERLAERLRQLKQDAVKMQSIDTDGDGQVSAEEWDRARQKVEDELYKEELNSPPAQDDDLVLAQGDIEKTFIVSDRDEKEVAGSIGLRCFFAAGGGAALLLAMAVSFIARTGLLASHYAIPWHLFYR